MSVVQLLKDEFNLRIYEESVWRIGKVLGGLEEKDVWYRPNDQSNSIGHLILHLEGNVTQWIGSGIGGNEDLRERELEFTTKDLPTKENLLDRLIRLKTEITDPALAKIGSESDLVNGRQVQGFETTVLSIIVHVIEHFSYHTGQIAVISKYMKGKDLGFYAGIDLNKKNQY